MCLYMSVPQWLNLKNFLKAINESINHTIHVSFMFIYFKCLNSGNNKNKQHATISTKPTVKQNITTQTNVDKHHHKIDFNVNIKKVNSFEIFALHKTCNEIGQMERMLAMQHKHQNLQQLNQQKQHYHLPPEPTLPVGHQ